jgi:hypothetical protein
MENAWWHRGKKRYAIGVFDVQHFLQTRVAKCPASTRGLLRLEKPLFYRLFPRLRLGRPGARVSDIFDA